MTRCSEPVFVTEIVMRREEEQTSCIESSLLDKSNGNAEKTCLHLQVS
jgi:hypothetical protein